MKFKAFASKLSARMILIKEVFKASTQRIIEKYKIEKLNSFKCEIYLLSIKYFHITNN
jgi:hypothetical protein